MDGMKELVEYGVIGVHLLTVAAGSSTVCSRLYGRMNPKSGLILAGVGAGLVLFQLRPQRGLGHSIQVFAGEKQAEQLGQCRHLRQGGCQSVWDRHCGILTR